MSSIDLSIIIISYNTKVLTAQTIESVGFHPGQEIIVVDNNSKDGSVEYLSHRYGKKIQLIARKDNAGFAIANNEGIKLAKGKYILLLNSDTIVQSGSIERMIAAMDENPTYGIISCRLENKDGSFQPQGGALPTLLNVMAWWLWPLPGQMPFVEPYQNVNEPLLPDSHRGSSPPVVRNQICEWGWVGGTAMLLRRETLDHIGLLDEKIFMYAEDVDLCIRAHQKGWKVGIVPAGSITHLGSASGSSNRALLGEVRGLLYIWRKHFSLWQYPFLRLVFWKGALLRFVLFGILGRDVQAKKLYSQILDTVL